MPAKRVLTITSPFLGRIFELYFGVSFASIPRALRVYQIIEYHAPIFKMCRNGDLEGVQNEFANGTISPFIVNGEGFTLLHVTFPVISRVFVLTNFQLAVGIFQPEMSSLLLRLGVDPDRAENYGV